MATLLTQAVHKNNYVSGIAAGWLKKSFFLFLQKKKKNCYHKKKRMKKKEKKEIAASRLALILATRLTGNRLFLWTALQGNILLAWECYKRPIHIVIGGEKSVLI